MKTFTTEMSDAIGLRVEAAFADNYRETIPNPDFKPAQPQDETNPREIANPKTKWQHACDRVDGLITQQLLSFEGSKAQNDAYQTKANEINKLSITTH